jgi:hypothetical protein
MLHVLESTLASTYGEVIVNSGNGSHTPCFSLNTVSACVHCTMYNVHTICETSAGIFKQSIGARNRVGIGLSSWPARLQSLA